jgi:hypothetical protein
MFSDLENVTDFLFLSKRILLYSLYDELVAKLAQTEEELQVGEPSVIGVVQNLDGLTMRK